MSDRLPDRDSRRQLAVGEAAAGKWVEEAEVVGVEGARPAGVKLGLDYKLDMVGQVGAGIGRLSHLDNLDISGDYVLSPGANRPLISGHLEVSSTGGDARPAPPDPMPDPAGPAPPDSAP